MSYKFIFQLKIHKKSHKTITTTRGYVAAEYTNTKRKVLNAAATVVHSEN